MRFSVALKIKGKHGLLQTFIDKKGWTQSDFAREVKVSAFTVGEWFNLKKIPSKKKMDIICKLLQETEEVLFPLAIRNKDFLDIKRQTTIYKEIDINQLPFSELKELPSGDLSFEDQITQREIKEQINKALDMLTPRQEKVLRLRFGLGTIAEKDYTLDEVAEILSITRERVRQIEAQAIRKLQHPRWAGHGFKEVV